MSIPSTTNGEPIATQEQLDALSKAQYLMSCTKKMSPQNICASINSLMQFDNESSFMFLAKEIVMSFMDIYQKPDAVLEIAKTFVEAYPDFKTTLTVLFGTPLSDIRIKIAQFRILRYLFTHETFAIEEIMDILAHYNVDYESQYLALFLFFAPEIEEAFPDEFTKFYNIVVDFDRIGSSFNSIMHTYLIDPMKTSAYQKHKKWVSTISYCETGFDDHSFAQAFLKNDERTINNRMKSDPNVIVPREPFFPNQYFQRSPPPILFAAYCGVTKLLSNNLFRLATLKDSGGKTVKEYAAAGGDLVVLQMLYDMKILKKKGATEVPKEEQHIAHPIKRDLGTVGLHACPTSSLKPQVETPQMSGLLQIAASERRLDAIKFLIEMTETVQEDIDEALVVAASQNHIAAIRFLLSQGASINAKDAAGRSPLQAAAEAGADEAVKQLLITPGIDINAKDDKEQSALHAAAYSKDKKLFDLLSHLNGIEKDSIDIYRNTPYQIAEEAEKPFK